MTAALRGRVLLLGDDIGVFLAVARSLGRSGREVHVVPAASDDPALASRYIAATHRLPPYHRGASAWIAAFKALCGRYGFDWIVPCSDDGLRLLHDHEGELGARAAIPNEEAFQAFADKGETRRLAAGLGVPVAGGRMLDGDATGAALEAELGLPLVLKPACSYRAGDAQAKTRARIVRTGRELACALPAAANAGWLAESFFPGDSVGVSVLARRGRILLAVQHRRIRTLSETGGASVRRTEALDPKLLADAERLAAAVQLHGVAMFEFREGSGAHALIEVNARFWGSLPLALAAGADFPARLLDMLEERGSERTHPCRTGLVRTNMTGEFDRLTAAVADARRAGAKTVALASLLAFAATLPIARRFDSWAADDPAPYFSERAALYRRIAGRLGRAPALATESLAKC